MFVTFEGLDGSGKSTQAELLRARLEADGVDVVSTREPGGTELGEQIRNLVLHGGHVSPWAEALLYAAARAQHVDEVIRPALERGAAVICDRYVDSSVAYQGVGRELGLERVLDLNLAAVGGLLPDRTFLLELEPPTIGRRLPAASTTGSSASPTTSTRAPPPAIASSPSASRSGSSSSTRRDLPTSSRRRCMEPFASVPEQPEAKRLLTAALTEGGAHAYLLHGPPGVGKRTAAFAFAAVLLGDERRVASRSHPDLYLLEPLGEMIRIDDVRALRHDLHMRPFEGDRRVYLVLDADRMNEEAADALLKDLEEPPAYAVIVLVAGELGPLPADDPLALPAHPVPPPVGARRARVDRRAGARAERGRGARARARVRRAARPRAPPSRRGRGRSSRCADRCGALRLPRAGLRPRRRCRRAARRGRRARRGGPRARAGASSTRSTFPRATPSSACAARSAEPSARSCSRVSRALEAWYRDLVVVAAGAEDAVVHADRLDDLREDAAAGAADGAVEAAESVREAWRALDEFNLNPSLALEALFVRLRRALRAAVHV